METIMRRLVLSLPLALTLSAVGASSALAEAPEGAQKAPLFGPFTPFFVSCETGAPPTAATFGSAVLNTPNGETTLSGEVTLKGAKPNTEYEVEVFEGSPAPVHLCGSVFLGSFTTNAEGNGNFHFTTARDPRATLFFVNVENAALVVPAGEGFLSPAVELD
jgi:hypothetical protein